MQTELKEELRQNRYKKRMRYVAVLVVLVVIFCLVVILNVNTGSVKVSVSDIIRIVFFREDLNNADIIMSIRLPRILVSAILGGALALSGFLLQTFFNNPIAGPFVLGISSGAKMCVALTMIVLMNYLGHVSSFALVVSAFIGALLAIGFVLLLSRRIHQMSILLVGGIMVGYICTAVTDFVVTFANDSDIVDLRNWSLGSFSGKQWDTVLYSAIIVGISFILVLMLSKPISAYQLGENYAQSMGVNVKAFRVVLILLSSFLAAAVTAFAGPISFVGIAVPHLIKRALSTTKPLIVIPATFMGGAVFCMFCDLIARTAFAPTELNISTVTAVFGAPVVIVMLLKKHGGKVSL